MFNQVLITDKMSIENSNYECENTHTHTSFHTHVPWEAHIMSENVETHINQKREKEYK